MTPKSYWRDIQRDGRRNILYIRFTAVTTSWIHQPYAHLLLLIVCRIFLNEEWIFFRRQNYHSGWLEILRARGTYKLISLSSTEPNGRLAHFFSPNLTLTWEDSYSFRTWWSWLRQISGIGGKIGKYGWLYSSVPSYKQCSSSWAAEGSLCILISLKPQSGPHT